MDRSSGVILFYLRFLLYLTAYLIPVFHPAIVVSYDSSTVWLWFLFVPLQMHLAFFGLHRLRGRYLILASAGLILASILLVSGISYVSILFVSAQVVAFLLTAVLFSSRIFGRYTGLIELGIIASLYIRLLGFSRASETFAQASGAVTQAILAISLGAIIFHTFLLYLITFREGLHKRAIREVAIFFIAAAIIGVIVAVVMPPDFVNHNIVLNTLREPPHPEYQPLDGRSDGLQRGNLQSDRSTENAGAGNDGDSGRANFGEAGKDGGGRLEGIAADEWNARGTSGNGKNSGSGTGESKQYAVMIVGSKHDPIYAADAYYETFDPQRGFLYTQEEPLNDLTYSHLIETWRNPHPALDPLRTDTDVFFLSTIPERVVPYDPVDIAPTVLDTRYHPFNFAYTVTSAISRSSRAQWRKIAPLTPQERERYAPFLEVDLPPEYRTELEALATKLFSGQSGYFQRLQAILTLYTSYQYELGFTDDVSVAAIARFLFETKNGDCTEFSNATALLARLAGIPSRVVTGYLATSGLQTARHRRALSILRESVKPLEAFPIEELFLVTTAHRHSWTQVLMPGYGWVDIETTETAIPPTGSMDPNSMDVVIPIITAEKIVQRTFSFPWLLVAQTLLLLGITAIIAAYLFKWGRRLFLARTAGGSSLAALSSLNLLVLSHMAAEGFPLKPDSDTPMEYAEHHPEFRQFAENYTRLRFGQPEETLHNAVEWTNMRQAYRDTKQTTRQKGLVALARRIISLRELRY